MNKLEKEWNLQGWSTKKPDSLGVFYFGLGKGDRFKGCNRLLWKPSSNDLQAFQNSQDNPNFSGVFKKTFLQPPCLFLFLEQTTDDRKIDLLFFVLRYPVQCTGLELIPKSLQNKICNRLHPKCTPSACFPILCSPAIWKSLFSRNRSYLCYFWYLQGRWLNVISAFWRQLMLRVGYSLVHSMKL